MDNQRKHINDLMQISTWYVKIVFSRLLSERNSSRSWCHKLVGDTSKQLYSGNVFTSEFMFSICRQTSFKEILITN